MSEERECQWGLHLGTAHENPGGNPGTVPPGSLGMRYPLRNAPVLGERRNGSGLEVGHVYCSNGRVLLDSSGGGSFT